MEESLHEYGEVSLVHVHELHHQIPQPHIQFLQV